MFLEASVTVKDMLCVILCIFAVGIGVTFFAVLVRLLVILKKVDGIISENRENVNDLMTALPEAVTSINEGVQSVKRTVDNAGETIEYISDNVTPKAGGFFENVDGIVDVVRVIGELARAAVHYFKKINE